MEPLPEHDTGDAERLATHIAERVAADGASFAEAARNFEEQYRQLLSAVAASHTRFAFDREGRPAAIAAVRNALPPVERDLLDAIVEDHACEVAAIEEALYRVACAARRRPAGSGDAR
jgi:hypothetical protein